MELESFTNICDKHNIEYTAKQYDIMGTIYTSKCPICEADLKKAREIQEKKRLSRYEKENAQRENEIRQAKLRDSNLPKRYIDFEVKQTENFKKYKHFLFTQENLFIYGNIGTGKTLFACEILKNNLNKNPLFLYGSDLALMKQNDFGLTKQIDKLREYDFIVIDEINYLLENVFILDLIVDVCYRDDKTLIMTSNTTYKDFVVKVGARIISRLSQEINIIEFAGGDLRK